MDELLTKLEELKHLNRNRSDYVLARANEKSIEAALKTCGMSKPWYYQFDEVERARLERLADELHYQKMTQAWIMLADAARRKASA